MRIKLNDSVWKINRHSRAKDAPRCDGITQYHSKTIYLDPKLKGRQLTTVLIHELLHAELPDLSEEAVEGIATDLEKVLWRFKVRAPAPCSES